MRAPYRAAILSEFARGVRDLGPLAIDAPLPPFDGDAVVDLDAQQPHVLAPRDLADWAARAEVTVVGVAGWALALEPPDANAWLQRTHARESDLAQVLSWTAQVPALAEARRLVEIRLAPALPLGATRRALVRIRRPAEPAATAAVVAALEARRDQPHAQLVPHAPLLAAALYGAATDDFRAWAFLAKLGHAAVAHRIALDLDALLPDAAAAAAVRELLANMELDRALQHFAFHWGDDRALERYVTYRGIRLDDIAVSLLLQRFGHPGFREV